MGARLKKFTVVSNLGLLWLAVVACETLTPMLDDESIVEVIVTGTPPGLTLTTFLDDLTGTGGRIRRPVDVGDTVIYDGLLIDYEIQVGIEDLATHACVGLDSAGIEFTPAPVRLRTQYALPTQVAFNVSCGSSVIDLRVSGLAEASTVVRVFLAAGDSAAVFAGSQRSAVEVSENLPKKLRWPPHNSVWLIPEPYTQSGNLTRYVASPQRVALASGDTTIVTIAYRAVAAQLDFTIHGHPVGDTLVTFRASLGSGARNDSATIRLNGWHYFNQLATGPVDFSFSDLDVHRCRILRASHPYTSSGGRVSGTLMFSGNTQLVFDLLCQTASIDLVVSGLPAGDSARILTEARGDAMPVILAAVSDTQTVWMRNGTRRVATLPDDSVRVDPRPVLGSDGRTYQAALQIVAIPNRKTTTVTVNYAPVAACTNQVQAWYALNGTARDSSGNSLHGTIQGTLTVPNRHGDAGAALAFDGIDDSIELGNAFNTLALPFSIAAWVYQPAGARGDLRSIFVTDDEPGRYAGIWLQIEQSGAPGITYADGGSVGAATRRTLGANSPIAADTWTHIVATVRGPTDMSLYVNGLLVPGTYSGTGGPLVHTAAPARIGNMTIVAANRPWLGRLDDLRVYNCSLDASEVAALHLQR